jgi:hypothetical protein
MDAISVIAAGLGGVSGGLIGESMRQRRLAAGLAGDSADRWDGLGFWNRYGAIRSLRRGRLPHQLSQAAAADLAAALRRDVLRRSQLVVHVALTLAVLAGAGWAASAEQWLAAGFLLILGLLLALITACQPVLARRLEKLEQTARARPG